MEGKEGIITSTIEDNKNIKKMKKQLSLGIHWSTYFKSRGEKIYVREKINEHRYNEVL